jgi:predicted dehydrogenase
MKTLVVGLGMGQLYVKALESLGHQVFTVDIDKNKKSTFRSLTEAVRIINGFDAIFICTPNSSHNNLAHIAAKNCVMLFVEKPGLVNKVKWKFLQQSNPLTRIIMIKNNMWRTIDEEMRIRIKDADEIHINWINRNRVPAPGSWFTTKKLASGGVICDLMPHLLSMFIAFNNESYKKFKIVSLKKKQRWQLNDLKDTEYGQINLNGRYDVDDWAEIVLQNDRQTFKLTADWRSMDKDDRAIHCFKRGELIKSFELGLCPESAYTAMIKDVFDNNNNKNEEFWNQHKEYDFWIHEIIND